MEGAGRPPFTAATAPESKHAHDHTPPEMRPPFESVNIDGVMKDEGSSESVQDVTDAVDVEFDDNASVDKLLAITGETWSIESQQKSLKDEAAKDEPKATKPPPLPMPSARPAVSIPTPYDFGALDAHLVEESSSEPAQVSAPGVGSRPPPLPGTSTPSTRPSSPPPPLPPLPPQRPSTLLAKTPATVGPPSRRPPPGATKLLDGKTLGSSGAVVVGKAPVITAEGRALVQLLGTRIERLEAGDDKVGLSRAHVELAIVQETLAEDALVNVSVEAALNVDPHVAVAHEILRRRIHGRTQLVPMLRHLERELSASASESASVELLVERARLLEAGDRPDDAREAWELALGRAPHHAAALKGLESDLVRRTAQSEADEDVWEDLVAHLGQMADAYSAQGDLAASLHVERARILELRLGRADAARSAFERALRLDPSVGPVRDAFTMHCAAHHDSARLAALLESESCLEASSARAARLELDAACIAYAWSFARRKKTLDQEACNEIAPPRRRLQRPRNLARRRRRKKRKKRKKQNNNKKQNKIKTSHNIF